MKTKSKGRVGVHVLNWKCTSKNANRKKKVIKDSLLELNSESKFLKTLWDICRSELLSWK